MSGHAPFQWDDEQWGEGEQALRRRRWRHPWTSYVVLMLAVLGVVLVLGSFASPGRTTVGAALVLLSPLAVVLSDGPLRRPRHELPPPPPAGVELGWLGVAVALVLAGLIVFSL